MKFSKIENNLSFVFNKYFFFKNSLLVNNSMKDNINKLLKFFELFVPQSTGIHIWHNVMSFKRRYCMFWSFPLRKRKWGLLAFVLANECFENALKANCHSDNNFNQTILIIHWKKISSLLSRISIMALEKIVPCHH